MQFFCFLFLFCLLTKRTLSITIYFQPFQHGLTLHQKSNMNTQQSSKRVHESNHTTQLTLTYSDTSVVCLHLLSAFPVARTARARRHKQRGQGDASVTNAYDSTTALRDSSPAFHNASCCWQIPVVLNIKGTRQTANPLMLPTPAHLGRLRPPCDANSPGHDPPGTDDQPCQATTPEPGKADKKHPQYFPCSFFH